MRQVGKVILPSGVTEAQARSELLLGGAAILNVGTTAGTVAAGDDSRFAYFPVVPPFPTTAAALYWRWSALRSQTDNDADGYAIKAYDISGNAWHTDGTGGVTNSPRWLDAATNGRPGVWFAGTNRRWKITALGTGKTMPVTILFVGRDFQIVSGNSHIYNWAGNPIGFGATTPLDYMYNGTLPAAHARSATSDDTMPVGMNGRPIIGIHQYDSVAASSIQSLNNQEQTVNAGNATGGTTGVFVIGADSTAAAQWSKFILNEFVIINGLLTAPERAAFIAFFTAEWGIKTP
jgi:hypothetical protein